MFRRAFRFFTKRWVLALLLVITLCLLVWFVGPLVAIAGYVPLASETWRFVVILVLLLGWGLNNLRIRAAERRAEERLTENLSEDADSGAKEEKDTESSAEQAMLAKRLKEALSTLQGSGLGRGKKLYRLPWYMVIGSPGSGKSTALQQSGLRFPLQSELGDNPVQGAGGTRYCDWWFTDEAVLIDTAGRYTTQDDPRRVETKAWLRFLAMLKKSRPKRPLNGILVTVSVQDLLDKTATQLAMQAAAVKHRIQELNAQLGMDLPVYVVFTKCDLVAGFNEFFADLEQEDREQVWGITFNHLRPAQTGAALESFPYQFNALIGRCNDRIPARLDAEREERRRGLIFEFPRQMLGLSERIQAFLKDIFVPNQFEQPALLRGVYFISATQSAAPGRWVRGVVPPALCADPVSGAAQQTPRSFFISKLLRNVVFAEAGVAAADRRARRRFKLAYAGALAGVCSLFVGTAAAWLISYGNNDQYLEQVDAHVDSYRARTGGGLAGKQQDWVLLANGLNELETIPTGYAERDSEPSLEMEFGLYQGAEVGPKAQAAYLDALERFLLPMTTRMLARAMEKSPDEERDDYLYEALRFYLMLYHPEHMDTESFLVWTELMWRRALPGERHEPTRTALVEHLRTALKEGVPVPPMDAERVKQAREILAQTPLDRRLYRRLKTEYMQEHNGEISVESILGRKGEVIFYRQSGKPLDEGIPEFFTYKHFHTGFLVQNKKLAKRLGEESWIYGDMMPDGLSDEELDKLKESVKEMYFEEYISRWRGLLEDLRIRSFNTASKGRAVVNTLASSQQPLMEFLKAVRKHTALSEAPQASKGAKEAADAVSDEVMRNKKQRLERLMPSGSGEGGVTLAGERVTDAFITFNDYVTDEQGLPLQRLQETLKRLSKYLDSLAYSRDVQETAFEASRDPESNGAALTELRRALSQAPRPIQEWFGKLPGNIQKVNAVATNGHVNDVWQSKVVQFYEEAIQGRYPVDPTASEEIRLDDFTKFFGPGGILDKYFQQYIKPFADTSGRTWRWREAVGIPNNALRFFQRTQRIRQAFFNDGDKPGVGFLIKPHYLDQAVTRSLLETAGTQVTYQHGPIRSRIIRWPGEGNDLSRVVFNLASRGTPVSTRVEGEWSWFRLLDRAASLQPLRHGDGYLVEFTVDGLKAQYELRPRSVHHPFGNSLLRNFTIPRNL